MAIPVMSTMEKRPLFSVSQLQSARISSSETTIRIYNFISQSPTQILCSCFIPMDKRLYGKGQEKEQSQTGHNDRCCRQIQ